MREPEVCVYSVDAYSPHLGSPTDPGESGCV